MKRITILLTAAALLLTVSVPTVLAKGGDGTTIALKAGKAFPAAKGAAKIRTREGAREFEAEVEHVRRLAGKRVSFFLGGSKIGTARVTALGAAHLERNSQRGQPVPTVKAGTRVVVRTAGGVKIVSGSF